LPASQFLLSRPICHRRTEINASFDCILIGDELDG